MPDGGTIDKPADGGCDHKRPPLGLTKNELLVWRALYENGEPLKAYEILDLLKTKGVRAPMTVYRALEGLENKGVVHKLEGLNAFVVCNHEGPHDVQVFMVCEGCGMVAETEIENLDRLIAPHVRRSSFAMKMARIELRGVCHKCDDAASGASEDKATEPVA